VIPDDKIVELMLARASRARARRADVAQQTYEEILERDEASPRQKAVAAINAGLLFARLHDPLGAIDRWSLVSAMRSVPFWLSCVAWMCRAELRYQLEDAAGAVCDYTAVLCHAAIVETHQEAVSDARVHVPVEWSPVELMGTAVVERGRARMALGDEAGAFADIQGAQKVVGVSPRVITRSRMRLAEVQLLAGRHEELLLTVKLAIVRNAPLSYLRVLSAFALLDLGREGEAIFECDTGLTWVRSIERINFLEKHLAEMLRRPGVRVSVEGLSEIKDRLAWRRQELETYAPNRHSDRDI